MPPNALTTKKNIYKLDFIKIKIFCASKNTIKEMKTHSTEWDKTFAEHIYDEGLVSRI